MEVLRSYRKDDIALHEAPGIDRLSNLPKDVLDQILLRLPIRDLVRTSFLSRKWRFVWSSIPVLTFDMKCGLSLRENPRLITTTSSRLSSVVDCVLLLRTAPIRRFEMSNYLNGYNSHVDKWILYLSRNGIEELHLQFDQGLQNIYKMSSCLFSCKQLRTLVVRCFGLMVPRTSEGRFMCLTHLELKATILREATILVRLISRCPRLETLILEYANVIPCFQINAAKLKSLRIKGGFKDIVLSGCPMLLDVDMHRLGEYNKNDVVKNDSVNIRNNLDKVIGCLPLLEVLTIEHCSLRFLASGIVLNKLFRAVEHLHFLHINVNFQDSKEISAALCIFRSSPRLETIEIEARWDDYILLSSDPYNWENTDCVFNQLKKIKMSSMSGEAPQMEFLKFVLASAPVLETMTVMIDKDGKEEETRILKSLLLLQRASVMAKVVYAG